MRLNWTKILARSAGCGLGVVAILALLSNAVHAAQAPRQSYNLSQAGEFVVADVRLQGLQRVSAGTVFNIIPISVGDRVDNLAVRQITRSLFASGYFNDIQIARDGGVLIVSLSERPAIESIELEGNKAIESEALLGGLADQGLQEGEIFKQATLERMGLELERQYVSQGRYGASIDSEIEELPRNRVNIKINVEEGESSGIRHINVVGNRAFTEAQLLDRLELKHPSILSFYRNDDKYAREKLSGDLETLEAFYKDRGYADFDITSTQVSITPDRQQVYITVGVDEGKVYTINDVNLVGELGDVRAADLESLIVVANGQTFSQALITATEERLTAALGNGGFTFATASGVPKLNDDDTVDVEFFVDAGKRAYVRRINFTGNELTQDRVMRREIRQMEAGWASTAQIDLSKVRLERLGYFKGVEVETPQVPGTDDQIDVDFSVEEQPSGAISGTLAYSQGYGLILGANYQQSNLQGSGNSLSVGLSYSQFQQSINFNYFDPYFTLDGISRGYNVFLRRLDYDARNIARYSTDAAGVGVNFGFPIGETQRINFGMNIEQTEIREGFAAAQEISEFIQRNGSTALNFKANLSWLRSTLNRGVFADRGSSQSLGLTFAAPGSDLEFYKVTYQGEKYFPLTNIFTLKLRTELGFGGSYGDSPSLPFYEHFFAGGFGSIRGFENSTLGPRSTPPLDADGNPIIIGNFDNDGRYGQPFGGNLLLEFSAELIFPLPFVEDNRQFRPALFFDAGNVFNTECPLVSTNCFDFDTDELRYSAGIGLSWLSGFGPLTFAISKPINTKFFDEEESFQFELGKTF
ncbi:MAG: outer membrane protein assembly factor BamA [Proteobacteria bacterium]|nr:outer membrane protein assembly factor BamA [Pseudomonadota bacterium]